jgi:hypothetical protein
VNGAVNPIQLGGNDRFQIGDPPGQQLLGPGSQSYDEAKITGWIIFVPSTDTDPAKHGFVTGVTGPWGTLPVWNKSGSPPDWQATGKMFSRYIRSIWDCYQGGKMPTKVDGDINL